ncbi:MAG: SMI1/KNR4 family protein [Phycisphaerales bacterium]|jgi:hypothetical protein|nr:SMI1/KNR4 family protein [Phycisphaerales bacterium]
MQSSERNHRREQRDEKQGGGFDVPWPNSLFIIGFDGCGNYYFVDLHGNEERVHLAAHERRFNPDQLNQIAEKYESIAKYVVYLQGVEEEIRAFEAAPESPGEQQAPKKWWQFWK